MVYLSAVTGVDPATGSLVEGTVTPVLENIYQILEGAGSHIDKSVTVNIFLTSMSDYHLMNQVYSKAFKREISQ
ncbi:hypothetical protein PENARI_c020G01472 [Penicillium arizonense]|uniref:Uncharacterized protein n=1 Tax=Penicillium arizonense TaxID=1835702 RepID=A0A1F5L903_PENAI|nr:hypothetical protein PENARI_c020G01472 [Penicillium arizonense]OGE49703.1 hypothetical protein PENARI_c020G01472 [Penicillium arizonense]